MDELDPGTVNASYSLGTPIQSTVANRSDLFRFSPPKDTIKLNLRGLSYEVRLHYLLNHPDTLLGEVAECAKSSVDEGEKVEVYFDRDPYLFSSILNYYVTGHLHFHSYICMDELQQELKFWRIELTELADCCWSRAEEEVAMDSRIQQVGFRKDNNLGHKGWRAKLHTFLNYHASSKIAFAWFLLVMIAVVASLLCLILETTEQVQKHPPNSTAVDRLLDGGGSSLWMAILESISTCFLTLELILQVIAAPVWYLGQITTWVEILGVLPIWPAIVLRYLLRSGKVSGVAWETTNVVLKNMKILRILLLFRLMRASAAFNIFTLAWRKSLQDTIILVTLIMTTAIFFGTVIFFVELPADTFESIPEGIWWALVTITTVGYGDFYPHTIGGRAIGGTCAVVGILVVATPIPIIVDKFKKLYDAKHIADSIAKKTRLKDEHTREKYRTNLTHGDIMPSVGSQARKLTCDKQTQTPSEMNGELRCKNGSVPRNSENV